MGSWWDDCAAADKSKKYLFEVVEYEEKHSFIVGSGQRTKTTVAPAVRIVLKEGLTEWNTGNLWMHLTKYAERKDKHMKKNAALSELQAAKETQIVTQSASAPSSSAAASGTDEQSIVTQDVDDESDDADNP